MTKLSLIILVGLVAVVALPSWAHHNLPDYPGAEHSRGAVSPSELSLPSGPSFLMASSSPPLPSTGVPVYVLVGESAVDDVTEPAQVPDKSFQLYPASAVVRPGRDSLYQVSFERGTGPTPKFHCTYTPIPKNPTGNEHRKGQATRMSLVLSID